MNLREVLVSEHRRSIEVCDSGKGNLEVAAKARRCLAWKSSCCLCSTRPEADASGVAHHESL